MQANYKESMSLIGEIVDKTALIAYHIKSNQICMWKEEQFNTT